MSQIRHGSDDQKKAALKELKSALQSLIHMIDEYEERLNEEGRDPDGKKESNKS